MASEGNKYEGLVNNNNAGVWSLEETIELCEKALSVISDDCFYLSSVADEVKQYPDLFRYLAKKFNDNPTVFRTIKRMYVKCERIITEKTGKGEITPALGIFILKSYHGLMETSRQQVDHTTKGESMYTLTAEEARKRAKELDDEY